MKISNLQSIIDRAFLEYLREIDAEEAERVRCLGCPHCKGRLHRADYPRKPRGIDDLAEEDWWRVSFCCEKCRRRTTPKSVRFLGRKVYLAVVVVVVCVLREQRILVKRVQGLYGVGAVTIRRWVKWWAGPVLSSRWWLEARARVMPPADEGNLIGSLYERFQTGAADVCEALKNLLRFVSPLTVSREYPS